MPRSRLPSVIFALDARIETLSALVLLARPRPIRLPYADKVRKHFGAFAKHPAVAELGRLLDRGVSEHLFAEIIFLQPDAGGLMTPELAAFFELLSDFSARSGAAAFFKAQKKEHSVFVSLARAEAAKSQRPKDISAYMRMPFSGTYRLILAPLLPQAFAVNVSRGGEELRVRNASFGRGGLTFEYDAFSCCGAHELAHTLLTPLSEDSRKLFNSYPDSPPKTCRDSSSERLRRGASRARSPCGPEAPGMKNPIGRFFSDGPAPAILILSFCGSLEASNALRRLRISPRSTPALISSFKA